MNYILDASVIASSIESFKSRFLDGLNIIYMTNLTFFELEARKKDPACNNYSKKFTRFLIDYFVRNLSTTRTIEVESNNSGHIDELIIDYAKEHDLIVITCDKGMALLCRFKNVKYELLESYEFQDLRFIKENNHGRYIDLFDKNLFPFDYSIFVISANKRVKSPLPNGFVSVNYKDTILLAKLSDSGACCIETFFVDKDRICLSKKELFLSETEIDIDEPIKISLFKKWIKRNK